MVITKTDIGIGAVASCMITSFVKCLVMDYS